MPRRIVSFDLDLGSTNMVTRFQCKDYEDVQLNINILQNGKPFDLTGCTFDFANTLGVQEIVNVNDNVLSIIFNTEGNYNKIGEAEIVITDEVGVLKTPSFFFAIASPLVGR